MSANPIPALSTGLPVQPAVPVGEIEAVCVEHSLPLGEPGSLDRFLRALHADKHLAMDFWSLVARLTDRYPSADSAQLLEAIVLGVTGRSLEEMRASDPGSEPLLRELTGLLAGEDVQTPLPPRPVQSAHPSDLRAHLRREPVPRRGAVPPPQSTPQASSGITGQPRLVLKTETPFAAAMDRNLRERGPAPDSQEQESAIAIPLAAPAEQDAPTSVSRMLVGAFLLLAAAGVLLYHGNWKRIRTSIRTQYAAVLAGRNHAAAPGPTSIDGGQGALTLNPRPSPTTRRPPAAPASPNPPQPVARPIVHPVAVPHTIASTPRDLANSKPQPAATFVVPEALMRRNLVSSRVPIFPAGAAGPVVIQAIVTARGTVEPLRVVTGDPALAHAAMVAAATWRYRPYLQNGVPVNVSTTISVDAAGN